jgi:hypothetical protein
MGSSYVMTTCFGWDSFCCRWTYCICLLPSDGMLAVGTLSMLPEYLYSLIDPSSGRSMEHHLITMLWLLFHAQIPVTWNAKLCYDICFNPGRRIGPCICCFMFFSLWCVKPYSIITVSVCALDSCLIPVTWAAVPSELLLFNSDLS